MIIYRVQDRQGRGPWKPGFSKFWVQDRTVEEYNAIAPPPMEVMMSIRNNLKLAHIGYGCENKEQLKLWFKTGEYQWLVRMGYRAVELEVDLIVWKAANQSAFSRMKPLKNGAKLFDLYP